MDCGRFTEKNEHRTLNIERPTSNIEWKKMKKQTYDLEERLLKYTEIAVECSVLDIRFSFDVGRSMFDVHFFYELKS
jgi:hypothetical protein